MVESELILSPPHRHLHINAENQDTDADEVAEQQNNVNKDINQNLAAFFNVPNSTEKVMEGV